MVKKSTNDRRLIVKNLLMITLFKCFHKKVKIIPYHNTVDNMSQIIQ